MVRYCRSEDKGRDHRGSFGTVVLKNKGRDQRRWLGTLVLKTRVIILGGG